MAATPDTPFIFDAGPLSAFARAGRLATLRDILGDARCLVTEAVRDELRRGVMTYPSLHDALDTDWLELVSVDGLAELGAFAQYVRLIGSTRGRDVGESATLAWAEVHGAIAVVDDRAAVNAARQRGVEAHGTLWLVVRGVKGGVVTEAEATALVAALRDAGAWFPFASADDFIPWARAQELLE